MVAYIRVPDPQTRVGENHLMAMGNKMLLGLEVVEKAVRSGCGLGWKLETKA